MVKTNAIRIQLAVAALVNSAFIHVQANKRPVERRCAYFLPITNCPQFIFNQYQEVGQNPARSATPKKRSLKKEKKSHVEMTIVENQNESGYTRHSQK